MNAQNSESVSITSGHITRQIESALIQLCNVLQIEHRCSFEDAVNTCRVFLIKKHIELLEDSDKEHLLELAKRLNQKVINGKATTEDKDAIKVLKLIGVL